MANNVKTVGDLLLEVRNKGITEIEPFLSIGHNPMIGSMYEGLAKRITSYSLFEGLDLRVVSGKVSNKDGKLSDQIDCMIVIGDGKAVPFTDDFIYNINQVIMVIEVKKDLYTKELSDGYHNLFSVKKVQVNDYRELELKPIADAFELIAKEPFPGINAVKTLSYQKQMLYHSLVVGSLLPLRVIFGFDGFASELTLRKKFIEYLYSNIIENGGGGRGFGPQSLPDLIIAGNNSIVKTNGLPFNIDIKATNDHCWFASYRRNPIILFLELLWSRLVAQYGLRTDIFGDEKLEESLAPLLIGRVVKNGWQYTEITYEQEQLNLIDAGEKEWEPLKLTEAEFILMNQLCNGAIVSLDKLNDDVGIQYAESMLYRLSMERLIYVKEGDIKLLTKCCRCAIVPDYGYVAADDVDGSFSVWLSKKITALKLKNNI